ncbi:MAG TPA: TIGR02221 family CRISPR-associated protein [Blastocatellia bacterium]|nr:TIGR02221 family CRISPR-associated protein [Blastocatellia bacterium]
MSSKKILTFLGTGDYRETIYNWQQQPVKTKLFPFALAQWVEAEQMLVLLTAEARQHQHWADLQNALNGHPIRLIPVDIPSGKSEQELWGIFDRMVSVLDEGDEIIFDVTHAFRSLPMLSLMAAAFLRVAKKIRLQHLLYGAYEARQDEVAPVFDLTPFISLLDWTTATDQFIKRGNASELATFLKDAHQQAWRDRIAPKSELPRHLQSLGAGLEGLSQALRLSRPAEVCDKAEQVTSALNRAITETETFARPFTLLLDKVRATTEPFHENTLASQRKLVHWYVEHEQYMQAATLAREWLVSWACEQLKIKAAQDRDARLPVEEAINQAQRRKQQKEIGEESAYLKPLERLAQIDDLLKVWDQLGQLRNDVAHCGMNRQADSAKNLIQRIKNVAGLLDQLDA